MKYQVQYAENKTVGGCSVVPGQVWSTHKSLAMAKREVAWLKQHGHKAVIVEVIV